MHSEPPLRAARCRNGVQIKVPSAVRAVREYCAVRRPPVEVAGLLVCNAPGRAAFEGQYEDVPGRNGDLLSIRRQPVIVVYALDRRSRDKFRFAAADWKLPQLALRIKNKESAIVRPVGRLEQPVG